MSLSNENKFKGIQNEWNSEEVIPYIKEQFAEMRSNAFKIVEKAFSDINESKNSHNLNLIQVEENNNNNNNNNSTTKKEISMLKCSQLELLKFLQYSNAKLAKYDIGAENIHIINP